MSETTFITTANNNTIIVRVWMASREHGFHATLTNTDLNKQVTLGRSYANARIATAYAAAYVNKNWSN